MNPFELEPTGVREPLLGKTPSRRRPSQTPETAVLANRVTCCWESAEFGGALGHGFVDDMPYDVPLRVSLPEVE